MVHNSVAFVENGMGKTAVSKEILIKGAAAEQLRERAHFLGTTPDELANRVIMEYLKEHGDETVGPNDDRFKAAAALMLKRHSKLYKNLAE